MDPLSFYEAKSARDQERLLEHGDWCDSFYEKIEFGVGNECWLWQGSIKSSWGGTDDDGKDIWYHYGKFRIPGTPQGSTPLYAHRIAYILWVGPIPYRFHVHHKCREGRCVNPAHLEATSSREHAIEKSIGSGSYNAVRATHCLQGHPYDEQNTRISKYGKRVCRACDIARSTARYDQIRVGPVPPKTHCKNGHLYTSTYQKNGKTQSRCLVCSNQATKAWQARNREKHLESRRQKRKENPLVQ